MKEVSNREAGNRGGTHFVCLCTYALIRIAEIGSRCNFSKVSGAKIAKPVNLEFRRHSPPALAAPVQLLLR